MKNGSCYKKVKVSCDAVSSVKYNCSNYLICRKIWCRWCSFLLNVWLNFTKFLFFWDFHGSRTKKDVCKCMYWNIRKKWWKVFAVMTCFSNHESACTPTLLKTVCTTGTLIDQVHKFHDSYFMETLKALILTMISLNILTKYTLSVECTVVFTWLSTI